MEGKELELVPETHPHSNDVTSKCNTKERFKSTILTIPHSH
jgi:hypothetical protein